MLNIQHFLMVFLLQDFLYSLIFTVIFDLHKEKCRKFRKFTLILVMKFLKQLKLKNCVTFVCNKTKNFCKKCKYFFCKGAALLIYNYF